VRQGRLTEFNDKPLDPDNSYHAVTAGEGGAAGLLLAWLQEMAKE
jgi:hypothetical protein